MNEAFFQSPLTHKPDPYPDRYLPFVEACRYLGGIKASTLRQWSYERRITYYKPGKTVLYRLSDLDAFMAQCARKSNAELEKELQQKQQELTRATSITNGVRS